MEADNSESRPHVNGTNARRKKEEEEEEEEEEEGNGR